MAGRVALLILATTLFAAAWSSDQEPVAAPSTSAPVRPYQQESVRETTLHRWRLQPAENVAHDSRPWTPGEDSLASYLVVDSQGRTERVVLELETDDDAAPFATQDHFITEQDGRRRHWIRLSTSRSVKSTAR